MKSMHIIRILSVLVMVFPVLVVATPAYAGGETHYQYVDKHFVYDSVWTANEGYNQCSFDMQFHIEGIWRINYWVDANGMTIREMDNWGGLKANLTANGKTVDMHVSGPVQIEYTFITPNVLVVQLKHHGTQGLITIPGYGKIVFGAGLFIETFTDTYDISNPNNWILISETYSVEKQAGNQDREDWEAFCEYMGS